MKEVVYTLDYMRNERAVLRNQLHDLEKAIEKLTDLKTSLEEAMDILNTDSSIIFPEGIRTIKLKRKQVPVEEKSGPSAPFPKE
jgi:prefoldin subunit 5